MTKRWLPIILVATTAHAHADPDEGTIESAPPPGAESGRVDVPSESRSIGRGATQAILYVPRTAADLVMAPVRGSIWAENRYSVVGHIRKWFFSDDMSRGLYPLVLFESTVGVLVGAQLYAYFSEHDKVQLFGGIGNGGRVRADAQYRTSGHFG